MKNTVNISIWKWPFHLWVDQKGWKDPCFLIFPKYFLNNYKYKVRHLTFFPQVHISWMITLISWLILQIISFILPPNEYDCYTLEQRDVTLKIMFLLQNVFWNLELSFRTFLSLYDVLYFRKHFARP